MADFYTSAQATGWRRLATTAAVVGAVAVGLSITLDQALKGGLPQVAIIRPDGAVTVFGAPSATQAAIAARGVDMTAVGSIDKVKIDPCTGKPKS